MAFLAFSVVACDSGDSGVESPPDDEPSENCIINTRELANSTGIDAIPALIDPELTTPGAASYLEDDDFIFGLHIGDQPLAIPHNILWWHEIVNLNATNPKIAVTFCPLTGSGIAFDRSTVGDVDFGVSGLLWRNNNVIFDRREDAFSIWSQMGSVALCSSENKAGTLLNPYPIVEMTWAGWKALYPETQVVSSNTGYGRNYDVNPLQNYTVPSNTNLFWPMPAPIDTRRLPKERVLGLPDASGGIAFPFFELDALGAMGVLSITFKGAPAVIFYDRDKRAAWAFWLTGDDAGRQFVVESGAIVDEATGSTWQVDGLATEGSLSGRRLEPIAEAYVAYWFAWAAFQPDAALWEN